MSTTSLVGKTLHHFDIVSELGRGGMAVVYKAHQTNLSRFVALKVLPPEMTFDQTYIARFQQEARAAAGLEHRHIVPIYEIGDAEGFYYITMKYIEGVTLKDVIEKEAPMSIDLMLQLLRPIGEALDYAHQRGVVHRDIKPSNVMITPEGWVYLTDFGLARGNTAEGSQGLTQAGTIMGTPEYMSPEQAQGLHAGPPSDLYSLAIMAYEMLTGDTPFEGANPQSILFARVMQAPRPPSTIYSSLPQLVEDVLMKSLARTPDARYPSAKALMEALEAAGRATATPQGGPAYTDRTIAMAPSGQAPAYTPPPISQPGYPQAGRPASQPSYPQAGRPASQPSYPQAGQPVSQPGYPQAGRPASQPSYPQVQQYVAAPPASGARPLYTAPGTASYYPQAGPGAQPRPAGASRRNLWLAMAVLLLLVVGGGLALLLRQPAKGADLAAGNLAFEREGGLDEAQTAYASAVASHPRDVRAIQRLTIVQLMRGRPLDAATSAQKAINIEPDNAESHALISMALGDQYKNNESLAQAQEAIRLDGQSSLAYTARANARATIALSIQDDTMLDDALNDSNEAIRLANANDRFIRALALNAKGYVLWQQYQLQSQRGDPDAATLVDDGIDVFNQAIGLQGQIPVFYANLGYFYAEQGYNASAANQSGDDRFDKATEAFQRGIELDAIYSGAVTGLGFMQLYRGQYEDALNQFDEALKRYPEDGSAMLGRGEANYWLERIDESITDFQNAIDTAPELLGAYYDLGYVYLYNKQDYANAEDVFKRALVQNNRYAAAHVGIGDTLSEQGYYTEADKSYDTALGIDNNLGVAYQGKGNNAYRQKQFDVAISNYDLALQYNAKLVNSYLSKAYALEQLDRVDEARQVLQEGLDTVDSNDKPTLQKELDSL